MTPNTTWATTFWFTWWLFDTDIYSVYFSFRVNFGNKSFKIFCVMKCREWCIPVDTRRLFNVCKTSMRRCWRRVSTGMTEAYFGLKLLAIFAESSIIDVHQGHYWKSCFVAICFCGFISRPYKNLRSQA